MTTDQESFSDGVPLLVGGQVLAYALAVRGAAFTDAAVLLRREGLPLSAGLLEAQRDLDDMDAASAGASFRNAVLEDVESTLRAAAGQVHEWTGRPGAADVVRECADMVRAMRSDAAAPLTEPGSDHRDGCREFDCRCACDRRQTCQDCGRCVCWRSLCCAEEAIRGARERSAAVPPPAAGQTVGALTGDDVAPSGMGATTVRQGDVLAEPGYRLTRTGASACQVTEDNAAAVRAAVEASGLHLGDLVEYASRTVSFPDGPRTAPGGRGRLVDVSGTVHDVVACVEHEDGTRDAPLLAELCPVTEPAPGPVVAGQRKRTGSAR
ncbi:hypothetical protein OG612_45550 (plasmid) [Streptomyces sp. NBC_01527]|uniref:hypothetical protein n=1 Tax=Streptomyces sp. NBC_01527 TaxID=2903894 RepID=UPI002F90BC5C